MEQLTAGQRSHTNVFSASVSLVLKMGMARATHWLPGAAQDNRDSQTCGGGSTGEPYSSDSQGLGAGVCDCFTIG